MVNVLKMEQLNEHMDFHLVNLDLEMEAKIFFHDVEKLNYSSLTLI